MYSLILVFWFASGNLNGGVAVQTTTFSGFISEEACNQEGQKAVQKLAATSRDMSYYKQELKWSCVKTKQSHLANELPRFGEVSFCIISSDKTAQ